MGVRLVAIIYKGEEERSELARSAPSPCDALLHPGTLQSPLQQEGSHQMQSLNPGLPQPL